MRGKTKRKVFLGVSVMVWSIAIVAMPVWAQPLDVFKQPGAFSWYELMTSDLFVLLDFLLLGAVIVHTMTGLAVILFDAGIGVRSYKKVYWVLSIIGAVLLIGAGYAAWYIITGS